MLVLLYLRWLSLSLPSLLLVVAFKALFSTVGSSLWFREDAHVINPAWIIERGGKTTKYGFKQQDRFLSATPFNESHPYLGRPWAFKP